MHIGPTIEIEYYILLAVVIVLAYISNRSMIKKAKAVQEKLHKEEIDKVKVAAEVRAVLSLEKSRSVTRGLVTEQFVPVLENFPYTLSDCYFLGKPFDYIIYDGMSEYRDGNKSKEIEIIFADVKYNTSGLTSVQTAIKKSIEKGKVKYIDLKVDKNNTLTVNDKTKKGKSKDGTESSSD